MLSEEVQQAWKVLRIKIQEYQRLPKRIRQVIQEALAFSKFNVDIPITRNAGQRHNESWGTTPLDPDPQLGIFKTARAAYQEQINQLSSPAKNEPESIKTHRLKQLAKIQEDLKYLDIFLQGD